MEVRLVLAVDTDAESIFDIQVRAFAPLLDNYQDYDTNPANETIDRVVSRINDPVGVGKGKRFASLRRPLINR